MAKNRLWPRIAFTQNIMHGNVENQKLKLDGVLIVGLKQFFSI